MRRPLLVTLLLAALAAASACGGDDAPAVPDSLSAPPGGLEPEAVDPVVATGWEAEYGPALFVAGPGTGGLEVVVPFVTDSTFADSSTWRRASLGGVAQVELFARAGRVATLPLPPDARVAMPALSEGCIGWPSVRSLAAAPAQWLAGFAEGRATAIPLDSIEGVARADSARLAADAARLASQIPNDTAVAFSGLPFFVRSAWRLRPGGDAEVLVADVVRRIAQEADPREQHVFLVAERSAPSAPWRLAWHARASGPEEQVETRELLAAVRLGAGGAPTLVVAVTYNEGSSYALVERAADGTWREKWASAYAGC